MPVLVDRTKTREQIAELAIGIIANEGIGGLTIRRVAEVAGTSRAIVSTYFEDMRDLTLAAFGRMVQGQVAILEAAERGGAGVEGCVEALLPLDEERLRYWRVVIAFYGMALSDPELADFQRERIDGAVTRFIRIIAEERGLARTTAATRTEARRIVTSIIGVSIDHAFHPTAQANARDRRRMVRMVLEPSESSL